MAVIDVYCEWLMNKTGNKVIALPDGLSGEKYLERLDILTKELFAPLTEYEEMDFRCGKAALSLIRKYCFTAKKSYGNAPQSAAFAEYAAATKKMIDDELFRIGSIHNGIIPMADTEKMFTIIANTLQLMTSVIAYYNRSKSDRTTRAKPKAIGVELPINVGVQKEIPWEREDTKVVDIIPYLDQTFGVNENFEKSKKNPNAPRKIAGEWAELKYLQMVLELSKIKLDEMEVF